VGTTQEMRVCNRLWTFERADPNLERVDSGKRRQNTRHPRNECIGEGKYATLHVDLLQYVTINKKVDCPNKTFIVLSLLWPTIE
jgi:hypothetical protein